MNAVQPKQGRYNLDFSFTNLTPGVEYRLWATRDAFPFHGTYLEVGRAVADASGNASYKLQTTEPGGLGFDLNTVPRRRHGRDLVVVRPVPRGQPRQLAVLGGRVAGGQRTEPATAAAASRIAAALRSTSSPVVLKLETEIRIAARPCQSVPPSQHVPSA